MNAESGQEGARQRVLKHALFVPVLGHMIRSRAAVVAISVFTVVHVGLCLLALPTFPCTFHTATGLSCPGCGITRSVSHFVTGHWRKALAFHPFGPPLLAGFLLVAVCALLPRGKRLAAADGIERIERRTGLSGAVLLLAALYGIGRLAWQVVTTKLAWVVASALTVKPVH